MNRSHFVWWLTPLAPLLAAVIPLLLFAWTVPPSTYWLLWGVPKFLEAHHVLMMGLSTSMFTFGCLVAFAKSRRSEQGKVSGNARGDALMRASRVLGTLAVLGYLIWVLIGFSRGMGVGDVTSALAGEPEAISLIKRRYLTPVAGLTSLTQFAPPAIAGMVLARRLGVEWPKPLLLSLVTLTLLRAQVHGERLALIEVAVAALVTAIFPIAGKRRPKGANYWPFIGTAAAVAIFSFFEYFRSWSSYYKNQFTSFADFILQRLAGYYLTAVNNSALLEKFVSPELPFPYFTLGFLWQAPGVSNFFAYRELFGYQPADSFSSALSGAANPEFNNPGGILLPMVDYGATGLVIFWFLAGLIISGAYFTARRDPSYIPLYAVLYVGLLEVARYVYWTQGRALPAIVGAIYVAKVLKAPRTSSNISRPS